MFLKGQLVFKSAKDRPFTPILCGCWRRRKCGPRLSVAAAEKLKNRYVVMRSGAREHERESDRRASIPITVRWVALSARGYWLYLGTTACALGLGDVSMYGQCSQPEGCVTKQYFLLSPITCQI